MDSARGGQWVRGYRAWLGCMLLLMGCRQEAEVVGPVEPTEPVQVLATVDRALATTGDLLTYRIEVDADATWEVDIPEVGAEIGGFRIVDVGRQNPVDRGGRQRYEHWYRLRADLVGSYVLPPVEVRYRQRSADDMEPGPWEVLSTSEIFVEVESVLPADGEATDIRGLKPLRDVRPPVPWKSGLAIALAVALVATSLLWYLRRRAARRELIPPIPAHELAFAALDRLRRIDFDDSEAVRGYYFEISEVVRAYVEGRFDLNATDLTTEEILRHLSGLEELAAEQSSVLRRFLVDTDQVKFAHRRPSREDIETTYERALGFVEATHHAVQAEEEEQAA